MTIDRKAKFGILEQPLENQSDVAHLSRSEM